jgi:hypothetical protein
MKKSVLVVLIIMSLVLWNGRIIRDSEMVEGF